MILTIGDGTTTANLIWHSAANRNYILARGGWAPGVPALLPPSFGNRDPYNEIDAAIEVHVCGESEDVARANLATLAQLLDQAERWSARESGVSPVVLSWAPGTHGPVYQAVITGRAPGDESSNTQLPATINADLRAFMIVSVQLRFRHRRFVGTTATVTSSTVNAAADPNALTISSAEHRISSPVKVEVMCAAAAGQAPNTFTGALLLLANDPDAITVKDAEGALTAKYTSVADAAGKARSGNVLRYTPTDTALASSGDLLPPSTWRHVALWAAVRNNSVTSGISWTIRASGTAGAGAIAVRTPLVTYTPDTTVLAGIRPTMLFLGYIVVGMPLSELHLDIAANTISGGPTLDVDYVVGLDGIGEYRRAISFVAPAGLQQTVSVVFDPAPLTAVDPTAVYDYNSSSADIPLNYSGDAYITTASRGAGQSDILYWSLCAWSTSKWRIDDTAGNLLNISVRATRYTTELTPN